MCLIRASQLDRINASGDYTDGNVAAVCTLCHRAKSSDEGHLAAGHKVLPRIRYVLGNDVYSETHWRSAQ